jgi:tetratricopeptide (TPR) repeat protein
MTLSESNKKASLTWSISGDFRRRYSTARFVQEFLQSGTVAIDGHSFLRIEQGKDEDETLQRLEETVNAYRPFVETLDALGITAKWDPEKMTSKELNDMGFMHAVFVEKKPLEGVELRSPVVNFNIQGAQVYALARKREEGGYELLDILSDRLVFVFGYPDQKALDKDLGFDPVPALMALDEEEFAKAVNLKPDKFSEQLDRFPVTAGNQTPLNQKVLEMLSAYDKGAKQSQALLACAAILARKLHEFDTDSQTYLLNLMQALKRRRELEDGEKDLLRSLVIDAHERYVQAAAYALLGDADMARRCLERCTKAEKAQIENYPISLFFRNEGIDA